MSAEPIILNVAMQRSASTAEVLAELRLLPFGRAACFEQADASTLIVRAGSRLSYRLLGMWARSAHLPAMWTFSVGAEGNRTRVDVSLTSDEGWYLIQTQLAWNAYQRRFQELLTAMEAEGFVRSV